MTRTFCDICGEELEQRFNGEFHRHQSLERSGNATVMQGEAIAGEGRKLLKFQLMIIPDSSETDICRQCVLEAVRYIADNK